MIRGSTAASILLAIWSIQIASGDPVSDGQWFHGFLQTAKVHAFSAGAGVTVALIDTGVDAKHPDLLGSVIEGTDLLDQADGRTDIDGHGTSMAGLIAAHGRVSGVAPDAKVLPVRISAHGQGSTDTLAQGVRWATSH